MKHTHLVLKLASLAAACLALMATRSPAFAAEAADRPNIIFLMTDDQRWDNFGCYGKPEFKTEHIDRLAKDGVIFDKAYYAVSICMPSRATMMTGRHISSHKSGFTPPYDYTVGRGDFADSYPARLKAAGYRTGFVGKFGFTVTPRVVRPNSNNKDADPKKNLGHVFDFFVDSEREPIMWPEDDAKLQAIYRTGRKDSGRTLKTGEAMLRFIDTQPADQPFCLSVSFLAVKHDKNAHVYPPHLEIFKDQVFSVSDNWVEGPNRKLPKVVTDNWRGARMHNERSATPAQYQKLVRRFAAQGYTVDQQVGLLMEKLKEKGMLDNTVVIYTSDNGRFHGSHGLFDKALLYEESMRAPLIVFDGRTDASQRDRRETALVSSVDIAPTILALAGIDAPP